MQVSAPDHRDGFTIDMLPCVLLQRTHNLVSIYSDASYFGELNCSQQAGQSNHLTLHLCPDITFSSALVDQSSFHA